VTADTPVKFDPYRNWLGIPPSEQPPDHYRLLGIKRFEDDPPAIARAADERMALVKTFQTGRHSELSQQVLNELAAARVCLLDAERKAAYDAALREQLARERAAPDAVDALLPPEAPRATLAQELLAPLRHMATRGPAWSRTLRRWWGPMVAVLVAICVMLTVVAVAKKFAPPVAAPPKTNASGTPSSGAP
jgi:hypothetical protein